MLLRAASTSSVRHFCLFGRRLTRFQMKEPLREQLQNVLSKNKEARKAPRADTIPPRPLGQVLIKGGLFYLMTHTLFFTAAAVYDSKNVQVQSKLRSMINGVNRFFGVQPTDDALAWQAQATKLIWALIGVNVSVFLLWQLPLLMPAMCRYFTSGVASKSFYLPMFLSMFSHQHHLHVFFNMYALKSFAIAAIILLGPAQFMAMYLSGGVFSGLLSLCQKAFMASAVPSLGASGAICAVIGYVCAKLPNMPVHIIFLPMFPFSANYGLYGFLAFETLCLLRILPLHRLVSFDHAAHIGGLLFGLCYAHYGEARYRHLLNWMRENVGALSTLSSSTTKMIGNRNKSEKGTDDGGWTTTPEQQQQQNNPFRKFRQHLIDEHEAQHERQKVPDEKHQDWAQTMAEQKKAEKDRIRRNKEARERKAAAAAEKSESAEEEIEDDDD